MSCLNNDKLNDISVAVVMAIAEYRNESPTKSLNTFSSVSSRTVSIDGFDKICINKTLVMLALSGLHA